MFVTLGNTNTTAISSQGGFLVAGAGRSAGSSSGPIDCSDTNLERYAMINGKCIRFCGADLSTGQEIDPKYCGFQTGSGGNKYTDGGGIDNKMLLLAAAGGVLLLILLTS